MLSLPLELYYLFSRYLNHRDYQRLRRTCKSFSQLHKIQFLTFKKYRETVNIYNRLLCETTRIRLDSQSFDDESFVYIAANGHSGEFIRLLQTKECANIISPKAKNEALSIIINKGYPKEMVCELLKNGCVDASQTISDITGTLLHWACRQGYIEIVVILLKYPKVDPCAKTFGDRQPIHYAASLGHTNSKILFNFSFEIVVKRLTC
jgi:hypothetical protein